MQRRKGAVIVPGHGVPETPSERDVWDRLARGIVDGSAGSRVTMTYHISSGEGTSSWLHSAPWLDFNMLQTWSSSDRIYPMVKADYERVPHKPAVMAEGAYENGPLYPNKPINALMIRRQAYWSYFAGGGHTYGNTDVWNFSTFKEEAAQDWRQALESPGAASITVLRRFLDSLPWWDFVPNEAVFPAGGSRQRPPRGHAIAGWGPRTRLLPRPRVHRNRTESACRPSKIQESWFNPATGKYVEPGEIAARDVRSFTPPSGWEDAILILRKPLNSSRTPR